MILREIVDRLIRSVSGGNDPSGSKYDPVYVESIIPSLREKAIKAEYNGTKVTTATKRVDYAWLNPAFTVTREPAVVTTDFVTFNVPKPLSINKAVDGFIYVGKENESVSFKKLTSREEAAIYTERGFFRNGKDIGYLWQQPNLEVYGNNALLEVQVRAILSNPLDAPNFDHEVDEYPITESVLSLMVQLFKEEMNINVNKPADTVLDNADTLNKAAISQNTRA